MHKQRRHYFPFNDQYVISGQLGTGMYKAILEEPGDDWSPGYGPSRLSAIADLVEKNGPAPEER